MRKNSIEKLIVFVVMGLFFGMSVISSSVNIVEKSPNQHNRLKQADVNIIQTSNHDIDFFDNAQELLSCDHLAYLGAGISDFWLYEFTLNDPGNLTCICYEEYIRSLVGTWTNSRNILACPYIGSQLYEIDPETCYIAQIGGGSSGITGLSMDPTTDELYGLYGIKARSSDSELYNIDPETGEQEFIGKCGVTWIISIAFDSDGVLYGWSNSTDNLYTIDIETGEATEVGSLGINLNYPSDGHFCMEDDILYLAANTYTGCYLYECDKDTGACTLIGQFENNTAVTLLAIPYWSNQPPYSPKFTGPDYGKPGVNYTFCVRVVDPDEDEIYCIWDWGDGEITGWFGPYASGDLICFTHAWSEEGTYTIKVKAKDEYGAESGWVKNVITIDGRVPNIKISKPQRAIYIRHRKIIPFIVPVIFGDISIRFSAEDNLSGLNRIELFIDDELKEIFTIIPWGWLWNEITPWKYKHVIKLIAYDNAGNNATKNMTVWRFF